MRDAVPAGSLPSESRAVERREEIHQFLLASTGYMAMPLLLAFWVADLVYWPSLAREFLILRLIVAAGCVGIQMTLVRRVFSLEATQGLGLAVAALNAGAITVMIWLTEGAASPYYAGLNLVGFASLAFFSLTWRFSLACLVATYGPYLVLAAWELASARTLSMARPIALNIFFMAATVLIAVVVRHFTERVRVRELTLRTELDQELATREGIIRDKTEEAVRLRHLSTHFSPQVIASIESGDIELGAIHRTPICAIFIDIVKSTDRIVSVNPDHVHRVIEIFLETSMKVLLKYDITIDKFLGDGVLAFSNDPVKRPDYQERVVQAALEIRSRVEADEDRLALYWPGRFQLRFGIASGEASVGFYGSPEYTQTYTAIGAVVNLASRLCAMAQPNQILVSKEVAGRLEATALAQAHLTGEHEVQGFADMQQVYEVQTDDSLDSSEVVLCPRGHGVLHLDDVRGILVMRCRQCDFQLAS